MKSNISAWFMMETTNRFFKAVKDNKNLLYYYSNKSFIIRFLSLIICWTMAGFFLLLAVLLLFETQDFIIMPITFQALLFIPTGFIILYFFFQTLSLYTQRKRNYKALFLPGTVNLKTNILALIFFLLLYILLIPFYWIPKLPDTIQSDIIAQWEVPFHVLFFMFIVVTFFSLGFDLLLRKTEFKLDKETGMLAITGRTFYRRKFSISFHFDEPVSIVIQPYIHIVNGKNMSNQPVYNEKMRILGVFLYLNEKVYLISLCKNNKACALAEQISLHSTWKYSQDKKIFYDTGSELELAII